MDATPYHKYVEAAESNLAAYAQKSFNNESAVFLNGKEMLKHFQDLWQTQSGQLKLANRTPLQLERDRILYSGALRKQTEKYHVLYSGPRRIVRNYTTHTMRMAHVTRTICKALRLNSDFAEAIAIGSKVGAAPFIHVTKDVGSEWLQKCLKDIDKQEMAKNPTQSKTGGQVQKRLFRDAENAAVPTWLSELESNDVIDRVSRCIPCAAGEQVDAAYHSGAESYWLLCTQPYLRESQRGLYHPETMFGIWRHTRKVRPKIKSFFHNCTLEDSSQHTITWQHSTFEGIVVQFADDMTWIIENLNDAKDAALLGGSKTNLFLQLMHSLGDDAPGELRQALVDSDAGGLYTYFITDFVKSSQNVLKPDASPSIRVGLREGQREALIGPSEQADEYLDRMKDFLFKNVFDASRIRNRNRMLQSVSQVSLDLLYDKKESALEQLITDRANLENWPNEKQTKALQMLSNDVHRAQLAVDVFVGMGDQEVFDFVGIHSF
jgi:dGTP triphosphohydrolase